MWQGFDSGELKREINELLARRNKLIIRRLLCEANISFYRIWLRDVWKKIEAALERSPTAPDKSERAG